MKSNFVELTPSECVVIDAREYARVKHATPMHPVITLNDGKSNYEIRDRYILYSFLNQLDPELQYLDMMHTIYEVSIEERPSLGDIIQGYLHNTPTEKISMWMEDGKIVLVERSETMSQHFVTNLDFIGANFLPDYTRSMRQMQSGSKAFTFPVMVFSKDNIKIEILTHNQKTFIAGRYKKGDDNIYLWVQPRPVGFCPRWAHLIPHDFLSKMLEDFRVLESMDELTKDSTMVGGGGSSDRLGSWTERNRLESENVYRFDRKTIEAINSFCNVEE